MKRYLLIPLVALVVALPAPARVMAPLNAVQRAVRSDAVVVGKVTAIEKEAVAVAPAAGDPNKVEYKVAVVKVESPLVGVANLTHIKVGFVPPPPADPNAPPRPGRGFRPVALEEGQEGLFFLSKHHSGGFYTIDVMSPPVLAKEPTYKADVEQVKKALAAVADPVQALKAEKQEDRFFAAAVLINRYRVYPTDGREVETVKVPAEESSLILKALADQSDWTGPKGAPVPATQAFFLLGLTDKDGWTPPQAQPGMPADFNALHRAAFVKWLEGPGKDYQLNRRVPKK
jgi:hypothetical protein